MKFKKFIGTGLLIASLGLGAVGCDNGTTSNTNPPVEQEDDGRVKPGENTPTSEPVTQPEPTQPTSPDGGNRVRPGKPTGNIREI